MSATRSATPRGHVYPHPLKVKSKNIRHEARLPFYSSKFPRTQYWAVRATGGQTGGEHAGQAMAHLLLHHLRAGNANANTLCRIVQSLLVRDKQEQPRNGNWDTEGRLSLDAQVQGFFMVLGEWLAASAKGFGGANLDKTSEAQLVERLNHGVAHDLAAENARIDAWFAAEMARAA